VTVERARYSYGGAGDMIGTVWDATGTQLVESTMTLPGGTLLTWGAAGRVWSYPNVHGDITVTANQTGTITGGTFRYDPYGQPLTGTPDNQAGTVTNGWLGQHQRLTDQPAGLNPIIHMGARPYTPTLGRFLTIDPIEGGCSNDYTYVFGDPVNTYDLDGRGVCPIGYRLGGTSDLRVG
jgi:RHS repeat-associated protein